MESSCANSPRGVGLSFTQALSYVFASALTNGGGPASHSYLTNKGNKVCVLFVVCWVSAMAGFQNTCYGCGSSQIATFEDCETVCSDYE